MSYLNDFEEDLYHQLENFIADDKQRELLSATANKIFLHGCYGCSPAQMVVKHLTLENRHFGLPAFRYQGKLPYWHDTDSPDAYEDYWTRAHNKALYYKIQGAIADSIAKPFTDVAEILSRLSGIEQPYSYQVSCLGNSHDELSTPEFWLQLIRTTVIAHYRTHCWAELTAHIERELAAYQMDTSTKDDNPMRAARDRWFAERGINVDKYLAICREMDRNSETVPMVVIETKWPKTKGLMK